MDSTRLWADNPEAMHRQIPRHLELLTRLIEEHGGEVFKTVGDAVCAVFTDAQPALAAAQACQATDTGFAIRVAVASGEARWQQGDYFGPALNLVSRLLGLGEPGRVLFPSDLRTELPARRLGLASFKGIPDLVAVSELELGLAPLILPCAGPNTLPQRLTPVLGRDSLIEELVKLLETRRLVTLIGFGGTGKTRLAIEVASRVTGQFPGGVFFCDLSEVPIDADRSQVLDAVGNQTRGRVENLAHLVVLDNCEHLLRHCSHGAQSLLEANANLRILATSRVPLSVTGQQNVQIPGLAGDASDLFCERVREQTGSSPDDLATVAKICEYLDGIPLALEIAAARCGSFSVQQVFNRMKSSSTFLRRPDALNDRHQGMTSVIEWSFQLLSKEAQAGLTQLSIMLGGFDYWGAGAILGTTDQDEIDQLIEELVRASLLVSREGRYRFFEPVREFGLDRLRHESDAETLAKDRLIAYVEDLAYEAHPHLSGPEQDHWIARLSAEHPNTRSAFEWMVDPARRANLAVKLHGFWYTTGRYREGRAWAEAALARLPEDLVTADILSMAGVLAWAERDLESADRHLTDALNATDSSQDLVARTKILNNLGLLKATKKDFVLAQGTLNQAEIAARKTGDKRLIASVLINLGRMAGRLDNLGDAEEILVEGMSLAEGNDFLVGRFRDNLGSVYRQSARPSDCVQLLAKSLEPTLARGDLEAFLGIALILCLAAEECGVSATQEISVIRGWAQRERITLLLDSDEDSERVNAISPEDSLTRDLTNGLPLQLHLLASKITGNL